MTIKIEREAVLYVLSRASSSALSTPTAYHCNHDLSKSHPYDDEAEIPVHQPKEEAIIIVPISSTAIGNDLRTSVPRSPVQSDAPSEPSRRVTFADPLVTDVRTRPRTLPEDLRALFYTYEETQRFRQEYRMERKMQADLEEDPATVSTSHPASEDDLSSDWQGPLGSSRRHRISRVVVRHQDTLETFFNGDCALEKPCPDTAACADSDNVNDFFDNDSFWSGSITWY